MPRVNLMISKNIPIKLISLFFGYGLWYILSQSLSYKQTLEVPVCFYNTNNSIIQAPETILITLVAKRSMIEQLKKNELALHINASLLEKGKNTHIITSESLFLPEQFKVVNYNPIPLIITVI